MFANLPPIIMILVACDIWEEIQLQYGVVAEHLDSHELEYFPELLHIDTEIEVEDEEHKK